jgi:GAF domain-containing protein
MSMVQDVPFTHQELELVARTATPQQLTSAQALPALLESPPSARLEPADIARIPLEVQSVVQMVQELLIISTGADGVAVALGDRASMQCVSSIGDAPSVNIPLQLDGTLSGQCVRTGRVVRFQAENAAPAYLGPRSALLAPVLLHGCVAGLVGIFSGEVDAFGNGSLAAIRDAASLLGLSMAKIEEAPASSCEIGWGRPTSRSPSRWTAAAGPPTRHAAAVSDRPLLGLPCPGCGTYSHSGESICGVCQAALQ